MATKPLELTPRERKHIGDKLANAYNAVWEPLTPLLDLYEKSARAGADRGKELEPDAQKAYGDLAKIEEMYREICLRFGVRV